MTRALIACLCLLLLCAPAAAQANNRSVTIDDVIQLTQSGISDETIITFLETREIRFVLSPQDIVRLRAAGISEELLRYLLQHTAADQPPAYLPPVAYGSGYGVPGYPAGYYTPAYAAGVVLSVGFPIVPHWLHEHHISHVAPHGAVGHLFGGGVHVITGNAGAHHGGASPFAPPFHPSGGGHGVTSVGLTLVGGRHVTGADHIGTVHGVSGHGGTPVGLTLVGGRHVTGADHIGTVHGASGHGVTSVGLTPVGASHLTGTGRIGTLHGAGVHGGAIVAAASGGHGTGGGRAVAIHGGGHSGGGHATGHSGGGH